MPELVVAPVHDHEMLVMPAESLADTVSVGCALYQPLVPSTAGVVMLIVGPPVACAGSAPSSDPRTNSGSSAQTPRANRLKVDTKPSPSPLQRTVKASAPDH